MQPNLGHLKAELQLAEMAYNADKSDHKKAVLDKAKTTYEAAWNEEQASNELIEDAGELATRWIGEISRLEEANRQLEILKHDLEHENSFLKSQLIEKAGKITELEKALSSAKSTPAAAPATTTSKPLTGAAKAAAEAKAAKAAEATQPPAAAPATTPAETPEPTDDAKKNS